MSAPTWEQIIDAVIAGDARIGPYIAREIVKADNAPKQPLPAIIVEIPMKYAEPRLHHQSDMETIGDRAGVSGVGNDVNVAIVTDLETDAGNAGNDSTVTVTNGVVLPLPEASRAGVGNDVFPRPKSRKGFSKELRRVWDYLDDHADEVTHDKPVQRDVAEATGVSHPTAGKGLSRWRDHNGITKPQYYQDQAS